MRFRESVGRLSHWLVGREKQKIDLEEKAVPVLDVGGGHKVRIGEKFSVRVSGTPDEYREVIFKGVDKLTGARVVETDDGKLHLLNDLSKMGAFDLAEDRGKV